MVRCEECGVVDLVDKPKKNWGICDECDARVCLTCLNNYHNDECEEADDEEEEKKRRDW